MASAPPGFGLPEEVLAVLPEDPFEQLDVARRITSIALSNRVSKLEEELSALRRELEEKDDAVAELQAQMEALDSSLEALRSENASLASTVKKLNRDVSKLEIFKKTLMQSLQEDEEKPNAGHPKVSPNQGSTLGLSSPVSTRTESDAASQFSETGSSVSDVTSLIESDGLALTLGSRSTTPKLTPPDSPTRQSASASPTRLSKPGSPRRQSIAFTNARQMFDERPSSFSSMPSSQHSSMSGSFDPGAHTGRARVDGKEFFRQVRTRLSYEQFSAFLANVKELNSHKQSREETLRKAEEIFGPDNRDLYAIFDGLISRNPH
ncbi:unnamed protein product [Spirodela intermedia]|uniref:At4g15545-like C-terminal domain-containing protein n=1 Tax=Spirodela intermedia TaxID=51605 RepID=A0A7I8I941_SPIIN|nr:unnamed protein product [Spirodela intermedia]CAA6654175.1 unnamed protein product [Spirodela intermedia]